MRDSVEVAEVLWDETEKELNRLHGSEIDPDVIGYVVRLKDRLEAAQKESNHLMAELAQGEDFKMQRDLAVDRLEATIKAFSELPRYCISVEDGFPTMELCHDAISGWVEESELQAIIKENGHG